MEKIRDNIFTKVIAFLILQILIVTAVISGVVAVFNASYEWYSSDREKVNETILQEMAYSVEYEIHNGLYYEIEVDEENVYWPHYLYKDTELPRGIGYEISCKKLDEKQLEDIALEKNAQALKELDGTYSCSMNDEWYDLTVYVADPEELRGPVSEIYSKQIALKYEVMKSMYQYRVHAILLGGISVVLMILVFVFLVTSIGRRKKDADFVDKLPLDLFVCVAAILGVCVAALIGELITTYNFDYIALGVTALVFAISVIVTGALLLCIVKVKRGQWWRSAVTYFVLKVLKRILMWCAGKLKVLAAALRKVPLVWKTALATAIIMVLNLVIAINMSWSGFAVLCWFVGAIIISCGVIYIALCMKRLKKAAEKLAAGDLTYKVDKTGLFLDFADHADNLNSIGKGMAAAVEEKTKSERFKAELITNVSHDIKTPLTSIINYVDLLKKEDIEDDTIKEYIDVLDRQSMRLKKLTEDIIDASKAATGNVKMNLTPCKIGLLVSQTVAEYKEKAEKENLEIIMKLPEEDIEVLADGRRLWRVFDNLFNNICKYAQPGTRVYINLEMIDGKAVTTYRNVSKYELDITEDELMERFVRGDKSRNTEGSGLGLSIARNLVELQDGSFDVQIDGDLFKVVIKFDLLNL